MNYIANLMRINPAAEYDKRNRWTVIVETYMFGQTFLAGKPAMTLQQITEGLQLKKGSSAWGSCYSALRRGVKTGILEREKIGRAFAYKHKIK